VELHESASKEEKFEHEDASRHAFLEHLAKTTYGEKKIQDELLNILLAGRNTTASFFSFYFVSWLVNWMFPRSSGPK
jgi:cytochrome P450